MTDPIKTLWTSVADPVNPTMLELAKIFKQMTPEEFETLVRSASNEAARTLPALLRPYQPRECDWGIKV